MNTDPLLTRICDELVAEHRAHTILLYGSHADGSAGPGSDYDVAGFAPVEKAYRVARMQDGAWLDIFVYPESALDAPVEDHFKFRGGKILKQRGDEAERILAAIEALHARGPAPVPPDELQARTVWAWKMVARIARGDVEGDYRRVWLLMTLLEDYFSARGRWYEGPKKALRWLAEHDPPVHDAYCRALKPGADDEAIAELVKLIAGDPE